MATAVLASNYLEFKNGSTTYLKLNAAADTLDFSGLDNDTDVSVTGINFLTATSLSDGTASMSGGAISNLVSLSAGGDITTTNGDITTTNGDISGNAITGTSLSAGVGNITGGALTVSDINIGSGNLTTTGSASVGSLTSSGAVSGSSFTDGTATLSSGTLSGLAAPTEDSHAVNKAYVDNLSSGLTLFALLVRATERFQPHSRPVKSSTGSRSWQETVFC